MPKRRDLPAMNKKMINRFFPIKTHRTPTWTTKTSSLKSVLCSILSFSCHPNKEVSFCRSFRFPTGLVGNSMPFKTSKYVVQTTLMGKGPLRVSYCPLYIRIFHVTQKGARGLFACHIYPWAPKTRMTNEQIKTSLIASRDNPVSYTHLTLPTKRIV